VKTYHYTISGRVQGVCFRHYTVREAERLAIAGTVRNLDDGSVEVFAQGSEPQIAQFERVEREVLDQDQLFRGFDISWE
jgi:acylphosphatase